MFEAALELVATHEVVIVGAGLAGMMASVTLARAGIDVLLLDAHESYPKSFKAEKLGNEHTARLRRLGMLDSILSVATPIRELLEAFHGTVVTRKPVDHYGVHYHDFINCMRKSLPDRVKLRIARVRKIDTSHDRQRLTLDTGETIDARLVMLATGRAHDLFGQLGLKRQTVSHMHSLSFGFAVERCDGRPFDFDELTYLGDPGSAHIAYATFFRIGDTMRANVFAYWSQGDRRTLAFIEDPVGELKRTMPGLFDVTREFRLLDAVESSPLHLQATDGYLQPGLIVIGDAFRTVCPAAGTGVVKVLNDVECLCSEHVPRWLSTPGMGLEKTVEFYRSPVKSRLDRDTLKMSLRMRKTAVDSGVYWRLRRSGRTLKRSALAGLARWLKQPVPNGAVGSQILPDTLRTPLT